MNVKNCTIFLVLPIVGLAICGIPGLFIGIMLVWAICDEGVFS